MPLPSGTFPYFGKEIKNPVSKRVADSWFNVEIAVVLMDSAASQKMHQELAPVWDAKCKEFMREMKDFRCQWC